MAMPTEYSSHLNVSLHHSSAHRKAAMELDETTESEIITGYASENIPVLKPSH
jgi:hypothetical protein